MFCVINDLDSQYFQNDLHGFFEQIKSQFQYFYVWEPTVTFFTTCCTNNLLTENNKLLLENKCEALFKE